MGQKVSPIGFRLVRNKKWRSVWYASKKDFGPMLVEDQRIRQYLAKKSTTAGASKVTICRNGERLELTIHTSRPGLVIGKKGTEIDQLRKELRKVTGKEVWIEVEEVKRPDLDAKVVADGVARQLERRMPFRRVVKKALGACKDAGAKGIKIRVAGRLGGAEIARSEWYKEGQIPLHTLRADIDYAMARAYTTYGVIGVKVWVNRGEEILGD